MDQKKLAEQLLALQDLLKTLGTQTPRALPDFTVLLPSAGGWGYTAVPASTIYRPSPPLLGKIEALENLQKECEDDPYAGDESLLEVRRKNLAEELAGEVRLTLLLGRLMVHVSRRRTERLIAALRSGVRAILDAAPSAEPSKKEAWSQIITALESGDEDNIFSAGFRAKLPLEIGGELLAELEAMQSRWDELQARRAAYTRAETLREHAGIELYEGELDEDEYYFDLNATCLRGRLLEQMRALLA